MTTNDASMDSREGSSDWGHWVSWIGIAIALIGYFFFAPMWLGIIGGILGIIALWGDSKGWAWTSIIVGAIVYLLAMFGNTVSM